MTDKIAINIAEALNAFVEQESDRYRVRLNASAARLVVQKHKLARLLTALAEVQRQVADYDNIEIFVAPHGHMAVAKVDNRRFSISTNLENTRFEIEEDYYSYGSGENQQFFYHYENDEEVLRLVMDAVGKYIALQRVIELGSRLIPVADGCRDADGGEEVEGEAVVSRSDAPEVLAAAEHALHGVAVAVDPGASRPSQTPDEHRLRLRQFKDATALGGREPC